MTSLEDLEQRHSVLPVRTPSSPNSLVQSSPPHPTDTSPLYQHHHHHLRPPVGSPCILSAKLEKTMFGRSVGGCSTASPPPVSSNPENNACRLVDYRGAKVAAFSVDGRELICLPQAFELFLKHLVGGLHTVYTKLKRLDVVPVVCNVEQVRVLRGLGAIQPGVNRCKLISPKEFDVLYEDCTNSSARPGRPPKRSAFAMNPEVIEKLKKNRIQLGSEFYAPGTVSLLGDAKKSLGFGGGYVPFSELQKSPLLSAGFHCPPAHLAHLAFMPLGHQSMMNLAMATHLSSMREHLVSSGHDRPPVRPEVTSLRGRGEGGGGGRGGSEDHLTEERSITASDGVIGDLKSGGGNSKTSAAAAAMMMMTMVPPSPPSPTEGPASLDRPLNLEVQKRPSCGGEVSAVLCRSPPSSDDNDYELSGGSPTGSGRHPISGQLNLTKTAASSPGRDLLTRHPNRNFRRYGTDRPYGNDERLRGNDDRNYGNDSDDDSGADENSVDIESDRDDSNSPNRCLPLAGGGRLPNGSAVDRIVCQTPPPPRYLLAGGTDASGLETLLVNIQSLVKLASERAFQKEQQITFERADMKIKTAKEREVRAMLEKQLTEERRKKVFILRKLKKERRTRRSLQDRLQSLDRGKGLGYSPLPHNVLVQPAPIGPKSRSDDYSGGSGGEGEGSGCRVERRLDLRSNHGHDNRRLRNASVSADDGNDSDRDESCGSSAEIRSDERSNSIHNLVVEGFISSAQMGCGAKSVCGNNVFISRLSQLKANGTP